ncbi:MAG: hypothetical protein WBA57_08140 [Elainellaceae cyanobacterium]
MKSSFILEKLVEKVVARPSSSRESAHPGLPLPDLARLQARSLDWHKLVALGLSKTESKLICQGLQTRSLSKIYLRRLQRSGIRGDDAKLIAAAIAHYDMQGTIPAPEMKTLLTKHGLLICRAALWRSPMFK